MARAELSAGIFREAWSAPELEAAISQELSELDGRRAAIVGAYNQLGARLAVYDGWCNTYGISALRKIIEGRMFWRMFSAAGFPAYHLYSNDPYFAKVRAGVDSALEKLRTTRFDVGKCLLVDAELARLARDPKQFERGLDEFTGSHPFIVLAGNLRLIEEEREILLELRGMINGSGRVNDSAPVERFIRDHYSRLSTKVQELRARTLEGYEHGFRVPLGELEVYNGKKLGFRDEDELPNFFWIFERRAYYVNQARLAAGRLFEASVSHYSKAEALQDRFLSILRESAGR